MNAADAYEWWAGACAAPNLDDYMRSNPIHPDDPRAGRYKLGNKNRQTGETSFTPVAYWYEGETLKCRIGDAMADDTKARELWTFCAKRPITNELYRTVLDHGQQDGRWTWPSENPVVTRSNNAPEDDSYEGITAQIESLSVEAKRLIKAGAATTQIAADQAADVAERLGKLWTKADNLRKVEKQPHLDAERAVDNRWRPWLEAAEAYKKIKQVVTLPFLNAEKKKREEAEKAAREERERAEREAMAAQEQLAEAEASGDTTILAQAQAVADAAVAHAEQAEKKVETVASAPAVKAGTRGRGVHLTNRKVARIIDQDKLYMALRMHPSIIAELQSIANQYAKINHPLDGMQIVDAESAV